MTDVLERIATFERELQERLATRTERCRFGTAYVREDFPRRWHSNFVWVDTPLEGVRAKDLAADADDVLGRAGLAHRVLWVADDVQAERLAPGMEELGYRTERNLVMVHAREPEAPTGRLAEEIDLAAAKRFYKASSLESGDIDRPEDAQMLADFREVLAERAEARFFGARVDGDVVAGCELYLLGDVAQVEDVYTLAAYRGRGLGRAVLLAALDAAGRQGAGLIFLGADAEDWPRRMYARLGFDVVDRNHDFVRRPGLQRS